MTEDPVCGATPSRRGGGGYRIKVWDAPTRVFHGLIVVLIGSAWWTESHDQMDWHIRIGCALLGVVVFRVLWGFVGGSTARFSNFVRSPATVLRYGLKLVRGGETGASLGHNPMGGWSVVALLAAMGGEVLLGLFCVDVDGVESGPLAGRVSFEAGRAAAHWHSVLFNLLLALIVLHLCAVAFYGIVRRDNLVGPMLTGRKRVSSASASDTALAASDPKRNAVRLLVVAILSAGVAIWSASGFKL